jgi:hypothetical protein
MMALSIRNVYFSIDTRRNEGKTGLVATNPILRRSAKSVLIRGKIQSLCKAQAERQNTSGAGTRNKIEMDAVLCFLPVSMLESFLKPLSSHRSSYFPLQTL